MKKKIIFGMSLVFGLLLINGGMDKFLHYMPQPTGLADNVLKDMEAFQEISWLMPLVGFAEVLGGLLLIFKRTRALGALMIFPVMVGVLLTHFTVMHEGIPMALVIWLFLVVIMLDERDKYQALFR